MNAVVPISYETSIGRSMTVTEMTNQVLLIQQAMEAVMKADTHYGTIPGCGDKPALLKPGAEKLCLLFRLGAEFHVNHTDLPCGHREYSIRCTLKARDGSFVGEGIGVCSTMENKFRYRWENTEKQVPSSYWDSRDKKLLGGDGYAPRKVNGKWWIFHREEHDNPADYYNTCAKMAKKRAHVDATLTATAASDMFEQDIEESPELHDPPAKEQRPGQAAVNKSQTESSPERDALIEKLEISAKESEASLMKTWGSMAESERNLVGAEFGRVKKLVNKA